MKTIQFLRESVFYPCSGYDFSPFRTFHKRFKTFVFADYNLDRTRLKEELSSIPDCHITYTNRSFDQVMNGSRDEIAKNNRDSVGRVSGPRSPNQWSPSNSYVLSAKLEYGPKNHDDMPAGLIRRVLFIRYEALAAYRSLYTSRNIKPKAMYYGNDGTGFGGNFYEFPILLAKEMLESEAGPPRYIFGLDHSGMGNPREDIIKLKDMFSSDTIPDERPWEPWASTRAPLLSDHQNEVYQFIRQCGDRPVCECEICDALWIQPGRNIRRIFQHLIDEDLVVDAATGCKNNHCRSAVLLRKPLNADEI